MCIPISCHEGRSCFSNYYFSSVPLYVYIHQSDMTLKPLTAEGNNADQESRMLYCHYVFAERRMKFSVAASAQKLRHTLKT